MGRYCWRPTSGPKVASGGNPAWRRETDWHDDMTVLIIMLPIHIIINVWQHLISSVHCFWLLVFVVCHAFCFFWQTLSVLSLVGFSFFVMSSIFLFGRGAIFVFCFSFCLGGLFSWVICEICVQFLALPLFYPLVTSFLDAPVGNAGSFT